MTKFVKGSLFPTSTARNVDGNILVETNTDERQAVAIPLVQKTVTNGFYETKLDTNFNHFIKPSTSGEILDSIINLDDKVSFVSLQSIQSIDVHNAYLQEGYRPDRQYPDYNTTTNIFSIFIIKYGKAFPIPNYKTLEILLHEYGNTYRDITLVKPSQLKKLDLNFDGIYSQRTDGQGLVVETGEDFQGESAFQSQFDTSPLDEFKSRLMISRDNEWNFAIRKKVEYKIGENFKRDPGEYWNPDDQEFDPQVFLDQTANESLRAKYEGKMVIGAWVDKGDDYLNSVIQNFTFQTSNVSSDENDLRALDDMTQTARIMILGNWRKISGGGFNYAGLNDINISKYKAGQGRYSRFGLFHLLVNEGAMEVMAGGSGFDGEGRLRNRVGEGKVINLGWRRFPHITHRNFGGSEYDAYFASTGGGNIFDNELLDGYEPKGSLKYYELGSSPRNTAELKIQMQQLTTDQGYEPPNSEALCNDIYDTCTYLKQDIHNREFNIAYSIPAAALNRISHHKNNLQHMFHVTNGQRWQVRNRKSFYEDRQNFIAALDEANDERISLTTSEVMMGYRKLGFMNRQHMQKIDGSGGKPGTHHQASFAIYNQFAPWVFVHNSELYSRTAPAVVRSKLYITQPDGLTNFEAKDNNGQGVAVPYYSSLLHSPSNNQSGINSVSITNQAEMRAWISRYEGPSWHPVEGYLVHPYAMQNLSQFYNTPDGQGKKLWGINTFCTNADAGGPLYGGGAGYKCPAPATTFDKDFTLLLECMTMGVTIDIPYVTHKASTGGGDEEQYVNQSPVVVAYQLDAAAHEVRVKVSLLRSEILAFRDNDLTKLAELYDPGVITDKMIKFLDEYDDLKSDWDNIQSQFSVLKDSITNSAIGPSTALELVDRLASLYYSQFYKSIRIYSKGVKDEDNNSSGLKRSWRIRYPRWILENIKNNTEENLPGIDTFTGFQDKIYYGGV